MREFEVRCPSGLTVTLRPMKVRETNMLVDSANQRGVDITSKVLTSVWVATSDTGPYTFSSEAAPVWSEVVVGDRFYAMMQLRIATHGPDFDFDVPCGNCGRRIKWSCDLNERPVQAMSEGDKQVFSNGNKLPYKAGDGRTYTFAMQTGKGERRAQQLVQQHPSSLMSAALLSRITDVDGSPPTVEQFDDLDADILTELFDFSEEHNCGVETSIDVVCPSCRVEQEVELPFGGRSYMVPTRRRKQARS